MTIALATIPSRVNNGFYCETLLQDPDGHIDELVEKYHSRALSRLLCENAAEHINRGNGLLIHNYEPLPEPKLNQLVIPTGATRWSYCLLLVDDTKKNQIYAACSNGETPMNLLYGSQVADRPESQHLLVITGYCLPPRLLSGETNDQTINKLWIIPFVDERYTWQFQSTATISETIQSITTPDALVDAILALPPVSVTPLNVKVSTAHTILPVCRSGNDYENLAVYIDSVLAHFGQRLVVDIVARNEMSNSYPARLPGQQSTGATRYVAIDGTNSATVTDNNLIGKLGLRECTWNTPGTDTTVSASAASVTVGTPILVAGGVAINDANRYALVPSSVDVQVVAGTFVRRAAPPNYKTIPAIAAWKTEFDTSLPTLQLSRVATDYYLQWSRQFDYTFAGVQLWQQGYCDDYIVYRQTWNPKTKCYDAFTRVCSKVPNATGEWTSGGNTAGGGTGNAGCTCNCIENGDIVVNGIETTSQWTVSMNAEEFEQANGSIFLTAGTYTLTWNGTKWLYDIGPFLTAQYSDGTNATSATTMDGELSMEWSALGAQPVLKLCVTGTVPQKPVGAGFAAGFTAGFDDGYAACVVGSAPAGSVEFGSFSGAGSDNAMYEDGWADGYDAGYLAGAQLCVNESGSAGSGSFCGTAEWEYTLSGWVLINDDCIGGGSPVAPSGTPPIGTVGVFTDCACP